MTRVPPAYFEDVAQEAHAQWDLLESRPALAAPWRQLFRQVQSPRHVLSELLQNADDAGAQRVRAWLSNDQFCFEHDGDDFNEENLKSLCGFGFSNKRHLHTIGFRGLGFKSTFSFGPKVAVYTPTLAIAFEHGRFTEPVWQDDSPEFECTHIQITVQKTEIQEHIQEDLRRWIKSPVPLLFFKNIKQLDLQDQVITKEVLGDGPVPNSVWMKLDSGTASNRVLLIESEDEPFPPEALQEIRSERGEQDFALPGCKVGIVVGMPGEQRLYVVLPSEVRPRLPFSFNAPFLQDPARTGIKDPITSPTNQWLLMRVGKLAASAMHLWLSNGTLDLAERARAYQLLPEFNIESGALDRDCARAVITSFKNITNPRPELLTHQGTLAYRGECLDIPPELLEVWPPDQVRAIFNPTRSFVLAPQIQRNYRNRLVQWGWLEVFDTITLLRKLSEPPNPPRPATLERLVALWAYLEPLVRSGAFRLINFRGLRIVPVRDKGYLDSAESVTFVGERDRKLDESDWNFLLDHIQLADPAFVNLISSVDSVVDEDERGGAVRRTAAGLFSLLKLNERTSLLQIIETVANQIFAVANPGENGRYLPLIAARAEVNAPASLKWLCRDGQWRSATSGLILEADVNLDNLLPPEWAAQHLLHTSYAHQILATERSSWRSWALRAGLNVFPVPAVKRQMLYSPREVNQYCVRHAGQPPHDYSTRSKRFQAEDFDFDQALWEHWQRLESSDSSVWAQVAKGITASWAPSWEPCLEARVRQVRGSVYYPIGHSRLSVSWIQRLQALPCLLDTFSRPSRPAELYRYNADTAPLINIERFVREDLDRPECLKFLDALGTQSSPVSIDKLIERLRALTQLADPPLQPLVDLYRTLDRVLARLDSQQIEAARGFFSSERLIRSNDGGWQTARSVFQQNDEDTPGVAVIHHSVADLSIWDRLEVPRRPTLELAVEWLKQIPPDSRPVGPDRDRIRQILRRAPNFVARQCGQWLDLTGRWTAIAQLRWVTFTRSVESGLFPNIRQATADLAMVDQFTIDSTPFAEVPILETELRRRITRVEFAVKQEPPAWIQALSKGLLRIQWTEDDQVGESPKLAYLDNQEQARRLLATRWLPIKSIEVTPYLDETPAGEARSPHVVWNERDLYVVDDGPRYHRELVEELQRQFSLAEVRDAIADCIERPAAWIEDYLAAHFTLGPELAEWSQNDDEEAATAEPVENAEANGKNNHEVRLEDVERRAAELTEKTETAASTDTPPVPEPTPTIENDVPSVTPGKPALTREDRVVAYMKRLGFQWDPLRKIFVDKRGNTVRQAERPFHWMIVDVAGQVRDRYWIGHKSFEAGLEIAAEVWEAMKHLPKSSWLLLPKEDGSLQAYRWSRVNERVQAGEIMLFAAAYRIRLNDTQLG